ncbi:unnamed protein product [Cladocopium goreaui]|uniref:Uncharacterized protein n=1 Tax=Cladocopium goreaui TaxID=2562237 RepID=A0A9P1DUB1_9DINO|nr:unnamed protein product [Cladocopium goreaui]
MAAQGTQEARAEQREEKPEKPTDPKGKLDRKIQSQPVLEPDGEKAVKKVKKEKNNTDGEKVATAVKAKAVPPKTESSGSADTARAVQDCLRRPSTKDIVPPETPRQTQPKNTSSCPSQPEKAKKNPGPAEKTKDDTKDTKQGDTKEKEKDELKDKDEKKKDKPEVVKVSPGGSNGGGPAPAGKKPPSPPGSPDHSDDEDSSEDSEERKKDELARVKREAHARYMRFSRSLRSRLVYLSGAPKLQLRYAGLAGRRSEIQGCSKFSKNSGRPAVAATDPEICKTHVRPNPDLHGLDTDETRQYLIWDRDGTEETVDHVTTSLFEAAEIDEPQRGRSRTKGKKGKKAKKDAGKSKKKRKVSSSSSDRDSSDSSSKTSSDSSSSSQGKKKSKKNNKKTAKQAKKSKAAKDAKGKKGAKKSKSKSESESEERETSEQRRKREEKEADEEKKKEVKAKEKATKDAFKKDVRKGNQALSKINAQIAKASTLDDKLRNMSSSVVTAIMAEVKPHLAKMKGDRNKLQKSVDAAKVDSLGTLLEDAKSCEVLEIQSPFMATWTMWQLASFGSIMGDFNQEGDGSNVEMLATLMLLRLAAALERMTPVFKNRTLNAVWKRIVWSLEAAFQGLHPTARVLLAEELQYFGAGDFCDQLVKKKTGEILLTAKAFNGRVIVMWLNHCLLDAVQRNPDHQILVLTSVAMSNLAKFFSIMEVHGRKLQHAGVEKGSGMPWNFSSWNVKVKHQHENCLD